MSVYVDDMEAELGRMKLCHMVADTSEELFEMADKVGVRRKWVQKRGTAEEHFDICLSMKKKAIKFGAKQIGWRGMAKMIHDKKLTLLKQTL